MKGVKYYYNHLSIHWNLKEIIKGLIMMTVLCIVLSILFQTTFGIILLIPIYLAPIVIITHSWFSIIKPLIKEVEKEIELEEKYEFFLNRFSR